MFTSCCRGPEIWVRSSGWLLRPCTQTVVCGAVAAVAPGSSLGNENLRPHPERLSQDLRFNKGPRLIILTVPQEHWWRCMLFCKLPSQKALNTGQVLFSYCPIMLYDKLPQNSVACILMFLCLWVSWHSVRLGRLGSKVCVGSACLPCASHTSATGRLSVMHFCHGEEKAQKGRGEPKWTAHLSRCLGRAISV